MRIFSLTPERSQPARNEMPTAAQWQIMPLDRSGERISHTNPSQLPARANGTPPCLDEYAFLSQFFMTFLCVGVHQMWFLICVKMFVNDFKIASSRNEALLFLPATRIDSIRSHGWSGKVSGARASRFFVPFTCCLCEINF